MHHHSSETGQGDLAGVVELEKGASLPIDKLDLVGELGDLLKPSVKPVRGNLVGAVGSSSSSGSFYFSNKSYQQDSSILNSDIQINEICIVTSHEDTQKHFPMSQTSVELPPEAGQGGLGGGGKAGH
jgi:hypothetical protein